MERVRNPFATSTRCGLVSLPVDGRDMMPRMTRMLEAVDTLFRDEPVLGVCGWSGSGKTTVLEGLIPRLVRRGLRVAAVKHDAHGVQIDRRGKDSDRLFCAGASVHLRGPGEFVWRMKECDGNGIEAAVNDLLRSHDVVIVEGHKDTPLPKVWCMSADGDPPPSEVQGIRISLPWSDDRVSMLEEQIDQRLSESLAARAVFGGVMIGGSSRRMGSPKYRLSYRGRSMLHHVLDAIAGRAQRTVVLGQGSMPPDLSDVPQLADAPGCGEGPLAALLTAFRWAPRASWLVAACDMPSITDEALGWLLGQRGPGRWAIVPEQRTGRREPLLALYEPQSALLLAELLRSGLPAVRRISDSPAVHTPRMPAALAAAWTNVNTPEEVAALES